MALDSPSSNDSLLPQRLPMGMQCLTKQTRLLNLYLSLHHHHPPPPPSLRFVLYLGFQRWRQQSSTSSTTSHSDIFTFHMVLMELVDYSGITLVILGFHLVNKNATSAGFIITLLPWYGRAYFHVLTCVERYLAVVHPVTYLNLKGQRGVRIRNICIGMSVLHVLIRPGPGEQGGDRTIVDQSKRRAFYTIVAILGVLLLRSCWNMALVVLIVFNEWPCVMMVSESWITLPSSLVLPLLFLHRAGKLSCCNKNPKGG
ncbi:hypothetical protein JOQ06_019746 [Pogonophryne albipinna]|uniref:Uncharacterized protein n=1 Tax=Pogonophryne albipinna TaxID=1090488 RepID=A0AAD6BS72_9TELE|nr:hypothetical protein JOQ06_019746 [Pogonophryne albipinna]